LPSASVVPDVVDNPLPNVPEPVRVA